MRRRIPAALAATATVLAVLAQAGPAAAAAPGRAPATPIKHFVSSCRAAGPSTTTSAPTREQMGSRGERASRGYRATRKTAA